MLKKIIVSFVILLLLAVIVSGFFFLQKQKDYKGTDPLSAVPVNSGMIIQFESLEQLILKLKNNTGPWQELGNFDEIAKINLNLKFIDSLAGNLSLGSAVSLDRPLTVASHLQGKNDIEYLYILPLNDYLEKQRIKSVANNQFGKEFSISKKTYHNATLYNISAIGPKSKGVCFAFSKGLFLASRSMLLLENSVRQLSSENSITNSKGFERVRKTIGKNVDANIFLNLKTFPKQVSLLLDKKHRKFIRNYTRLANWTELDLAFRNRVILLNGFTYSDPQEGNLMNLFLQQAPVKMEMESVIPASTSVLAILGIGDTQLHNEKYRKFLDQTGNLSDYQKDINTAKRKTGVDFEKNIYSVIYKEVGLAISRGKPDMRFTIIRTRSASIAKSKLLEMVGGYAKKQNRSMSYYKRSYKPDSETGFDIYRLPEDRIPEKLFGDFFKDASSAYFTFIGNYLIMGPGVSSLSGFIDESVLGKTLANDQSYQENKEFLSDKANFFFYTSTPKANKFLSGFFNRVLQKEIKTHKKSVNKFQAAGLQLSSDKKFIYNNLFVGYDPVLKPAPQTDWESKLDTCFKHKPHLVKNHYTNENEIMLQDVNNRVYLLNPAGRILWKKQLSSAIVGSVRQVDYFKNNKLQYLFVTKNRLHLIDRNGNYVKKYPVRLQSNAAGGASVFDYDKNKDYRIFVPCMDQKVYAYSKKGSLVRGWSPAKAENPINCEVQHFRVQGKDYIVYADRYRTYILNRRGQERVRLEEQFSKSEKNPFYLEKANRAHKDRLVTTDSNGTIRYCYFNGKVEKKSFAKLPPSHYFTAADLTGNGFNEYLLSDSKSLKIFGANGKLVLKKKYDSAINSRPNVYEFSKKDIKIGVCSEKENKIYLLDINGNYHKGFPLKGNTGFSIGLSKSGNNSFNLYVGDKQNFLLNYSIQ